ncbi:MAG: MFS transporter, partial [Pseudomonadota bacterium]
LTRELEMSQSLIHRALIYRWIIFWIMAISYVIVYFHRLSPAVVAVDLQNAFGATGGFMGLLASAYFYPYAFMQFPAGLLSDSLGPRKTVTGFLILAAIGSILFGLAPNMEFAVVSRVLVGIGVSMVFIPTMKLISNWFRNQEFAMMTAIVNVMGGVGALTAAGPLAAMTGWVGWRVSFEIIGAATFLMAIMVWIFVRNRPEDLGWAPIAQMDRAVQSTSTKLQPIRPWQGAKIVLTERHFWPVAIWFFFTCGIFFSFGGLWAGPYFINVYQLSKSETGSILNMIAVGLIVGSPLFSLLSDRVFKSRKKVLCLSSTGLLLLMALLNLFPDGLPYYMLFFLMLFFSITSSAIVVIGFTTTKELFPVEIAGTSVGAVNLFPFLGGAIFQPFIGWILDMYPRSPSGGYPLEAFKSAFLIMLMASVVCVISALFMRDTFPGKVITRN